MSPATVLVFRVEGQRFALPAAAVERVVRAVEVTPLPGAPPLVLGVVDVGGRVLPVLDLRGRLELPPRRLRVDDQLVIVDTGMRSVVLPIDEADGVVDEPAVLAGSALASGSRGPLRGVLQLDGGMAWIHDLERLFLPAEAEAFDRALREPHDQALA